MESQTFDDLTRALASGATRRGVLKGVLAGAFGLTGISGRASAQATTVPICHLTDDPENPVVLISVSANAVPAHEAHGDAIDPDFSSDTANCDGCGIVCPTPENGTATCVEGTCGFACDDGYQPNPAGDGCEEVCSGSTLCGDTCVDTATDPDNCGGCGNVCTSVPDNATATCAGGACGFACDEGYQLNAAGDACEAISACPEGYEALNGGCFLIVNPPGTCPDTCLQAGSIDGSGNFLCSNSVDGTSCASNSECEEGSVCQTLAGRCFVPCG